MQKKNAKVWITKRMFICSNCGIRFKGHQITLCKNCLIIKNTAPLTGRDKTREMVRARDNFTCQKCRKKWKKGERRFDIHHLKGLCGKKSQKYDRVSETKNLITLCHKCHMGIVYKKIKLQ